MVLANFQKLCDGEDWRDDRVDFVIRQSLKESPNFRRKQWEFAMIYLALESKGKLHENSRGIAFGAGRERLIYALAQRVGHLLATDLYKPESSWIGARTDSPREWLLSNAPFPVDAARLDAEFMDMTSISYQGEPVDFCYSSCSFEHIGKTRQTFIDHLKDVRRILKDDGVYVLTTELNYGETLSIPHMFFFNITDLLGIVADSGFSTEPIFNAHLARMNLNEPALDPTVCGLPRLWQPQITLVRAGRVFTSALLILSNNRQHTIASVEGYEETEAWLHRSWNALTKRFWGSWQNIDPFAGISRDPIGHEGMTFPNPSLHGGAFHTAWVHFGAGPVEMRLSLGAPPNGQPIHVRVVEMSVGYPPDRQLKTEAKAASGPLALRFDAAWDKIYAVLGRGALSSDAHVMIHARAATEN